MNLSMQAKESRRPIRYRDILQYWFSVHTGNWHYAEAVQKRWSFSDELPRTESGLAPTDLSQVQHCGLLSPFGLGGDADVPYGERLSGLLDLFDL